MITVLDAKLKRGYSGVDHYITGYECEDVIGRKFRSVSEARKAADFCAAKNVGHSSLKFSPVSLTVVFANGKTQIF